MLAGRLNLLGPDSGAILRTLFILQLAKVAVDGLVLKIRRYFIVALCHHVSPHIVVRLLPIARPLDGMVPS